MPGVTGREVTAAIARSSTWGTPASVLRQILVTELGNLDTQPTLVDDDAFNVDFQGTAETGDFNPIEQDLVMQMRFESAVDHLMAVACGSVVAPSAVSSQGAANSLVAYEHVVTLARELTHFITLAVDTGQYVVEVPTAKIKGFSFRNGDNGRMMITFPTVGNDANYSSAVNVAVTVTQAESAALAHRVFRKNTRLRMNVASGGALGSSDELGVVREFAFTYGRPLAQDDHVFNSDYIIEPDEDGIPEFGVEMTFARMNTVTANSLAIAFRAGGTFKADILANGAYINSATRRSLLFQMPALQLYSFRAPIAGHNQVRPVAQWRLKTADAAPTGMAVTDPFKLTITNANSRNLITGLLGS